MNIFQKLPNPKGFPNLICIPNKPFFFDIISLLSFLAGNHHSPVARRCAEITHHIYGVTLSVPKNCVRFCGPGRLRENQERLEVKK